MSISVGYYVAALDVNNIERVGVCTQIVSDVLINVLVLDEEHLHIHLCKRNGAKDISNETTELDYETFQLYAALQNFLTR